MPDYKKSKIYKIVCNITGLTYYGSTVQSISKRIGGHRDDIKRNRGCKSGLVLAGSDYSYSLVEECQCENKEQLLRRERFWVENNECVNKQIPGRTLAEWREANKEKIKEQEKQYREQNKDKRLEYQKEYRESNKEKITEKNKKYYEANVDKIKEQKKQYRESNKERTSEKIECEFCKSFIRVGNMARHHKTKKCQKISMR